MQKALSGAELAQRSRKGADSEVGDPWAGQHLLGVRLGSSACEFTSPEAQCEPLRVCVKLQRLAALPGGERAVLSTAASRLWWPLRSRNRLYGPWCLEYFLFGPLQEKFAEPWPNISEPAAPFVRWNATFSNNRDFVRRGKVFIFLRLQRLVLLGGLLSKY